MNFILSRLKMLYKIMVLVIILMLSLIIIVTYSMIGFNRIKIQLKDIYGARIKLAEESNLLYQKMLEIDSNLLKVSNMSFQNIISENLFEEVKIMNLANEQISGIKDQIKFVEDELKLKFLSSEEKELLTKIQDQLIKYESNVKYATDFISTDVNIFNSYIQVAEDSFQEIKNTLINLKTLENGSIKKSNLQSLNELDSITLIFVIISIISIVISLLLAFFIGNSITNPIKNTIAMLKNISEGEGDLTKKLIVSSKDEIKDLSIYFNNFIGKLQEIIINIKSVGQKSNEVGMDLASVSEEVSANVVEISASMNSSKEKITILNNEILNSDDALMSIKNINREIIGLIKNQSLSVNNSFKSINEMIESINHITSLTAEKKNLTDELGEMAKKGSKEMGNTITAIDEISNSVNVILEMISVVNNVAKQTNLLAINAAIEAAHAGEYGTGFSVVAEEIRNLAEATDDNSKNISSSLKSIITKIHLASEITKNTNLSIGNIISDIYNLANSMNDMLQNIKEISEGSNNIINTFKELVVLTDKVVLSSTEMNLKNEVIGKSMNIISNLSNENLININEMNTGLNEIVKSTTFLANLSSDNADNIRILDGEILKFKT